LSRKHHQAQRKLAENNSGNGQIVQQLSSFPPEVQRVLEHLPKEQRSIVFQVLKSYSGPTPPAELLRAYEELYPGSSKIIIDLYAQQVNHRIRLESTEIPIQNKLAARGQIFGFISMLMWAFLTGFAIYSEMESAASILGGVGVSGIVAIFITGKLKQ
jgi:uncharacterized membrane protein